MIISRVCNFACSWDPSLTNIVRFFTERKRPDPWPQIVDSEEFSGQSNQIVVHFVIGLMHKHMTGLSQQSSSCQHASSKSLVFTSLGNITLTSLANLLLAGRSRVELFFDRHGTAHTRNLLKTPLAQESSLQTSKPAVFLNFPCFVLQLSFLCSPTTIHPFNCTSKLYRRLWLRTSPSPFFSSPSRHII